MGDLRAIPKAPAVTLRIRRSHRWALCALYRGHAWGDATPALVRRRERTLRALAGDWDFDALEGQPLVDPLAVDEVPLSLEEATAWQDLIGLVLPRQPHATAMVLVGYHEALGRLISGDAATPAAEG